MLSAEKSAIFDCRCGITKIVSWQTYVKGKFHILSSDFDWIVISAIKVHYMVNKKFTNYNTFLV